MFNQLWVLGWVLIVWVWLFPFLKQSHHFLVRTSTLLTFLAGGKLVGMVNVCGNKWI